MISSFPPFLLSSFPSLYPTSLCLTFHYLTFIRILYHTLLGSRDVVSFWQYSKPKGSLQLVDLVPLVGQSSGPLNRTSSPPIRAPNTSQTSGLCLPTSQQEVKASGLAQFRLTRAFQLIFIKIIKIKTQLSSIKQRSYSELLTPLFNA